MKFWGTNLTFMKLFFKSFKTSYGNVVRSKKERWMRSKIFYATCCMYMY